MIANDPLPFRVYSEPDGKVYLLYEPENLRLEVKPLNENGLEVASLALCQLRDEKLNRVSLAADGESEEKATQQQRANRQLKAIVDPRRGFLGFVYRLLDALFEGFAVVFAIAIAVYPVYKGVQYSQAKLPELLHLVLLLVFAGVLALSVYVVAAPERLNEKQYKFWYGKNGLLFLSSLNLVGAASVFASLTFWMYQKQWVILKQCAVGSRSVDPGALLDFYVFHLIKLVPFLNLKDTLKWDEPICYEQANVGVLVLLFQGLVVLPCINAIRYSWKNRKLASAKPYKYIYEPGWKPESVLEP